MRARRVEPSEPVAVGGAVPASDYADAFEVDISTSATAEQWARATLEKGPAALRWFVGFGWRYVLRLRLGPNGAQDHVAGWPIVLRSPETVVLEVESGVLGHARLTFQTGPASVHASSNVTFEHRGAAALWSVAGLLHRRILPYLLGHAAASPPS